jgi:choline-phosphate cytidylyltransferase
MTRSRQTNRDSVHGSDSSEEENESPRGRTGKSEKNENEEEADAQLDAMMAENSKRSGQ